MQILDRQMLTRNHKDNKAIEVIHAAVGAFEGEVASAYEEIYRDIINTVYVRVDDQASLTLC